jgi:hypothetical protein
MLHVATVHYRSPQWIEIQNRHLREHISVPYRTWSSLQGIDPSYARYFDRILEQGGLHAAKLNHLAMEICQEADEHDLLMFLDGDAFPIADPMPLIEAALERAPLVAIRRAENVEEPQPHPSFCVTTVASWRALHGDWTAGPMWPGARGQLTTDVGANLLRRLELTDTPWVQVLRSNKRNLDPLYFGVYGDVIYHHGAGFRAGELSPAHRAGAPAPLHVPDVPLLRSAARAIDHQRWRRWERGVEQRHLRQSRQLYEQIQRGEEHWLEQLI